MLNPPRTRKRPKLVKRVQWTQHRFESTAYNDQLKSVYIKLQN